MLVRFLVVAALLSSGSHALQKLKAGWLVGSAGNSSQGTARVSAVHAEASREIATGQQKLMDSSNRSARLSACFEIADGHAITRGFAVRQIADGHAIKRGFAVRQISSVADIKELTVRIADVSSQLDVTGKDSATPKFVFFLRNGLGYEIRGCISNLLTPSCPKPIDLLTAQTAPNCSTRSLYYHNKETLIDKKGQALRQELPLLDEVDRRLNSGNCKACLSFRYTGGGCNLSISNGETCQPSVPRLPMCVDGPFPALTCPANNVFYNRVPDPSFAIPKTRCQVCGALVTEDSEPKAGEFTADIMWGPNMFNGKIDETNIVEYRLYVVDADGVKVSWDSPNYVVQVPPGSSDTSCCDETKYAVSLHKVRLSKQTGGPVYMAILPVEDLGNGVKYELDIGLMVEMIDLTF